MNKRLEKLSPQERASEFIERHTKVHPDNGQTYIDAVAAITELYARLTAQQSANMEITLALSDAGGALKDVNERLEKLEGKKKIEIYSPGEAKDIIN